MGFNLPFLVGADFKRSFIQWPTQTQAEADEVIGDSSLLEPFRTGQRPECSLAQIMAICWRVKEWSFSGSWTATGTRGGDTFDGESAIKNTPTPNRAATRTAYPDPSTPHETDREIDLVSEFTRVPNFASPLYRYYSTIFGFHRRNHGFISPLTQGVGAGQFGHLLMNQVTSVNAGTPETRDGKSFQVLLADNRINSEIVAVPGNSTLGLDIVVFDSATKKFYPRFAFRDAVSFGGESIFGCITPFDVLVANASFTIDPGAAVAASFTAPLIISGANGVVLTTPGSTLTMTATKFWPYSDENGDPIYDETTGSEL